MTANNVLPPTSTPPLRSGVASGDRLAGLSHKVMPYTAFREKKKHLGQARTPPRCVVFSTLDCIPAQLQWWLQKTRELADRCDSCALGNPNQTAQPLNRKHSCRSHDQHRSERSPTRTVHASCLPGWSSPSPARSAPIPPSVYFSHACSFICDSVPGTSRPSRR